MSRAVTRSPSPSEERGQASECLVSILAVFSDILTIPDTK